MAAVLKPLGELITTLPVDWSARPQTPGRSFERAAMPQPVSDQWHSHCLPRV